MVEANVEQLARFQSALMDLLAQNLSAAELESRLLSDAAFIPFRQYLQGCEPRMLQVAADLVKKWGRRHSGGERPAGPEPESPGP